MKMAVGLVAVASVCLAAVSALPLADPGLLRVPRIYNALISSDAKLQPSRAFPYSSPVYQPLAGPDQWPTINTQPDEQGSKVETPKTALEPGREDPKPMSDNLKASAPLTFYPRSFGYYQPQPIAPYSYPFGPQPYVFGPQPLYRYPAPYYGGTYAPATEQVGSGYMAPRVNEANVQVDKYTSDSVGVPERESEFLSDYEEEDEKGSATAETS